MQFTHDDLVNLSALARISLKEGESEKMLHDMQAILGYVSEINSVSGEVKESSRVVNVTRHDEVTHKGGELTEALLSNAPFREGDYVAVKNLFAGK